LPCPWATWKKYSEWGKIKWVHKSNGKEMHLDHDYKKSNETNRIFKWYEEKTDRYISYEANAKKFMLEDDYKNHGKCPIMSFLTTESQVEAKMNED
jgi:hypothetical protein